MAEKYSDFPAFLDAMHGKRLLHMGHKHADCDALGSAYAMSRILPGDVGFACGMKVQAWALAEWLELECVIEPDPTDYEYTIIYDTLSVHLLGVPLPDRYAIFDHHESGGHRFSTIQNQLADGAEWGWVWPIEATCSLLIDLFQKHNILIDEKMAVALAAGIVTDTVRLRQAHGPGLRRLSIVLEAANLHVEDIWAVLENPTVRSERRPAMLNALSTLREVEQNGWSMLVAEIDSQDNAFVMMDTIIQLGWDIGVVGFSKNGNTMVITICTAAMVLETGIDLGGLMKALAPEIGASDAWGTRSAGRIIAPMSLENLIARCVETTQGALEI
jgi:nanoRNase/pAp phosphatase (c-di-AMP/oligoRNAs hydrolase)